MAQEIADSTLLDTWGSGGNIVEPDISKIIEGWQLGEQPPHEYMNWLQNIFGSKLNHILKNGVVKWNNETEYLAGSSVQHNGNVWLCKTTNTNSAPTDANANWKRIITVESLTTVLGGYVALTGNQTIAGIKTFTNRIAMSSGTNDTGDIVFEDPTNNTSFLLDMADGNFRFFRNYQGEGYAPILGIPANTGLVDFAKNPTTSETQSGLVNALTRKDYVDGLDSANVKLTGNQTIAGVKTFSASPIVPTPTTGTQAANKDYADLKVALAHFTGTNQSKSVNGYQMLPGGIIIQWGFATTSNNNGTLIFPVSFPNETSLVFATNGNSGSLAMDNIVTFGSTVLHNSSIKWNSISAFTAGDNGFQWFAIGY